MGLSVIGMVVDCNMAVDTRVSQIKISTCESYWLIGSLHLHNYLCCIDKGWTNINLQNHQRCVRSERLVNVGTKINFSGGHGKHAMSRGIAFHGERIENPWRNKGFATATYRVQIEEKWCTYIPPLQQIQLQHHCVLNRYRQMWRQLTVLMISNAKIVNCKCEQQRRQQQHWRQ